jgi:hypothetical protein
MADGSVLNDTLANIGGIIAAIAGLGTAAAGLVDACKAFWGGISNIGYWTIKKAVDPLVFDPPGAEVYGRKQIFRTLRANWINGVDMATQKATAKSLIHLGVNQTNAPKLAAATGIDAVALTAVAKSIADGTALTPQQVTLLGQLDAMVSAILDAGYERADQRYRNAAKLASAVVAVVLAAVGGYELHPDPEYLHSHAFCLALLVGAIATPLAPVAKDLTTALAAAAGAVGSVKLKA